MAPSGRSRKRDTRMEAAIEHLGFMGFSRSVVSRKVKQLLKVYGGDDGWVFIETDSYSLLIESLLEDQQTQPCKERCPSPQNSSLMQASFQNDTQAEPSMGLSSLSRVDNEPSCSGCDAIIAGAESVVNLPLSAIKEEKNDEVFVNDVARNVFYPTKQSSKDEYLLPPPGFGPQPLPCGASSKTRKPCYGWIDKKDEDDYVLLTPHPVQRDKNYKKPRMRSIRWDLRPTDL